jgi:hypothetical protein
MDLRMDLRMDLKMDLRTVLEKVVKKAGVHNLLTDAAANRPLRKSSYGKLVGVQRDDCRERGLDLGKLGYQTGEPWSGDLEKALVLFVTAHPPFVAGENVPRYHTDGTVRSADGGELSLEDVEKFLRDRFQNAPISGRDFCAGLVDGEGKPSGFAPSPWLGYARNTMRMLLPPALKGSSKPESDYPAYLRRLLKYAACVPLVPFRTVNEIGVAEALGACVNQYARYILPHAAAPVVILAGETARRVFLEGMLEEESRAVAAEALEAKRPYVCAGGVFTGEKAFIAAGFSRNRQGQGKWSELSGYPAETLRELRKRIASAAALRA